MFISAALILAIVSGALAFKNPDFNAFECQTQSNGTQLCKLIDSEVNPDGITITIQKGAVTDQDIADVTCSVGNCLSTVRYSREH